MRRGWVKLIDGKKRKEKKRKEKKVVPLKAV